MQWQQLLFSQGFGTRRICAGLVQQGLVRANGAVVADATAEVDTADGMTFMVEGVTWTYHERAYLMLHKPAGYECSQRPGAWPSVYTLLPGPLRQRPGPTATTSSTINVVRPSNDEVTSKWTAWMEGAQLAIIEISSSLCRPLDPVCGLCPLADSCVEARRRAGGEPLLSPTLNI